MNFTTITLPPQAAPLATGQCRTVSVHASCADEAADKALNLATESDAGRKILVSDGRYTTVYVIERSRLTARWV